MNLCHQCPNESHPPTVNGSPTCLACKLNAARDVIGRAIGARSANGRAFADLSAHFGAVHGTRTVEGVEIAADNGHQRQRLVVRCVCGSRALLTPTDYRRGVGRCRECRGTGTADPGWVAQRSADAARRKKLAGQCARRKAEREQLSAPDVCDCSYRSGLMWRACSWHRVAM